jgi:hypothetical protein
VDTELVRKWAPDELWELAQPLIPAQRLRVRGGGTAMIDARAVLAATAHRRFVAWTMVGLWRRLHRAVLDRLGEAGEVDWSRAIVDAASVRAKKGDSMTGPNPVDWLDHGHPTLFTELSADPLLRATLDLCIVRDLSSDANRPEAADSRTLIADHVLILRNPQRLNEPISLEELRSDVGRFQPPQSYRYIAPGDPAPLRELVSAA